MLVQVWDEWADNPMWSPDMSHLYFNTRRGIARVEVTIEDGFISVSEPEVFTGRAVGARMAHDPTRNRILISHIGPEFGIVVEPIAEVTPASAAPTSSVGSIRTSTSVSETASSTVRRTV